MNGVMFSYPSIGVNEEISWVVETKASEKCKKVYDNARFQYTKVKIMSLIRENVIAVIA